MPTTTQLAWDEVQEAASQLFNVWTFGTELAWAEEAWGHLTAAGLVPDEDELSATSSRLMLATLARVYHGYCGAAWEEYRHDEAWDLVENLEISDLCLGLLSGQDPTFSPVSREEAGLKTECLDHLIEARKKALHRCLLKAYGGAAQLHARLHATNIGEENDDDEAYEVTGENLAALAYIEQGFTA